MNCSRKFLLAVAGLIGLSLNAATADNPYHSIVDRNPFGLNPPVFAPTNNSVEPLKTIKFNGISSIGNSKKAFFTILGKDSKTPPQYVAIAENEKVDVIEVVKIANEGEVEVINSGTKMTLNFKENGNKQSSPPPMTATAPLPTIGANPLSVVYGAQPVPVNSPSVVQQNGVMSINTAQPEQAGVVFSMNPRGGKAAEMTQEVDVVNQRMNMLAEHMISTATYEKGLGQPIYHPDPKIASPQPTDNRKRPLPPPPPMPPSPPSLSALTGE